MNFYPSPSNINKTNNSNSRLIINDQSSQVYHRTIAEQPLQKIINYPTVINGLPQHVIIHPTHQYSVPNQSSHQYLPVVNGFAVNQSPYPVTISNGFNQQITRLASSNNLNYHQVNTLPSQSTQ